MRYLFVVCSVLFLFIGCKKEKEEPTTPTHVNGAFHANLNGEPWNIQAGAQLVFRKDLCNYDCLKMGGGSGSIKTFLTALNFYNIRKDLGIRQALNISPYGNYGDQTPPFSDEGAAMKELLYVDFYTAYAMDQTCDVYKLLLSDSINNYITITEQSDSFREISGEFSATFVRTVSCSSTEYPEDTLRFRNGTFHFTNIPDLR